MIIPASPEANNAYNDSPLSLWSYSNAAWGGLIWWWVMQVLFGSWPFGVISKCIAKTSWGLPWMVCCWYSTQRVPAVQGRFHLYPTFSCEILLISDLMKHILPDIKLLGTEWTIGKLRKPFTQQTTWKALSSWAANWQAFYNWFVEWTVRTESTCMSVFDNFCGTGSCELILKKLKWKTFRNRKALAGIVFNFPGN